VRLTGTFYDEGKSGTALSVGTMLFASALGALIPAQPDSYETARHGFSSSQQPVSRAD